MVRVRYAPDERQQMREAGMAYSYKTVSYVLDCSESTVKRYTRALSDPLPVTVVPGMGGPPRITQDDISLTETILMAKPTSQGPRHPAFSPGIWFSLYPLCDIF